jgi:hypothetical protein
MALSWVVSPFLRSTFQLEALGGPFLFGFVRMQPIGRSATIATKIIQSTRLVSVMSSPIADSSAPATIHAKATLN